MFYVERRRESRIPIEENVYVTVLDGAPSPPVRGRALDLSGRGLSLKLAHSLPVGVAVKVDQIDRLLLGEVIYCLPEGDAFRIGIEVDQALRQTNDLVALRRALQTEAGAPADARIEPEPHASSSLSPPPTEVFAAVRGLRRSER